MFTGLLRTARFFPASFGPFNIDNIRSVLIHVHHFGITILNVEHIDEILEVKSYKRTFRDGYCSSYTYYILSVHLKSDHFMYAQTHCELNDFNSLNRIPIWLGSLYPCIHVYSAVSHYATIRRNIHL